MTQSIFPSQTSNDELKAMLGALADAQRQSGDKMVEILVRLKTQDEKLSSQGSMLLNFNQRLGAVEAKAERTARQQEELEGDVLREVGVQARKLDALSAETKRQSTTLDEQSATLEELVDDKKTVMTMLKTLKYLGMAGPVVAGAIMWAMQHVHL